MFKCLRVTHQTSTPFLTICVVSSYLDRYIIYLSTTYLITCQKTRFIFSILRLLRVKSQNRRIQEEPVPSSPSPCGGLLQTCTHPKQQAVGDSPGLGVPMWSVHLSSKGRPREEATGHLGRDFWVADSRRCSRKRGPGSGWATLLGVQILCPVRVLLITGLRVTPCPRLRSVLMVNGRPGWPGLGWIKVSSLNLVVGPRAASEQRFRQYLASKHGPEAETLFSDMDNIFIRSLQSVQKVIISVQALL